MKIVLGHIEKKECGICIMEIYDEKILFKCGFCNSNFVTVNEPFKCDLGNVKFRQFEKTYCNSQ